MRSLLGGVEKKVVVDEVVIPRVNNAELVLAVENVVHKKEELVEKFSVENIDHKKEELVEKVPVENIVTAMSRIPVTEVCLGLRAPNPKLGGWTEEYGQIMLVCCATLMRRGLEPTGVGGCI